MVEELRTDALSDCSAVDFFCVGCALGESALRVCEGKWGKDVSWSTAGVVRG